MRTSRSTRLLSGTASDPPRLRACELRARHQTATRGGPGGGSPRGRGGVADGFRDSLDDATAVGVQPLDCTLLNTLFWLLLFDTLRRSRPRSASHARAAFRFPRRPVSPARGRGSDRTGLCACCARATVRILQYLQTYTQYAALRTRDITTHGGTRSARWYEVSLSRGSYGVR